MGLTSASHGPNRSIPWTMHSNVFQWNWKALKPNFFQWIYMGLKQIVHPKIFSVNFQIPIQHGQRFPKPFRWGGGVAHWPYLAHSLQEAVGTKTVLCCCWWLVALAYSPAHCPVHLEHCAAPFVYCPLSYCLLCHMPTVTWLQPVVSNLTHGTVKLCGAIGECHKTVLVAQDSAWISRLVTRATSNTTHILLLQ